MQNLQYPLLSLHVLQFMSAASLRNTSSTPASSTNSGESSENSPTEGSVTEIDVPIGQMLGQDFFWKYGGIVALLVEEETVVPGTPLQKP